MGGRAGWTKCARMGDSAGAGPVVLGIIAQECGAGKGRANAGWAEPGPPTAFPLDFGKRLGLGSAYTLMRQSVLATCRRSSDPARNNKIHQIP